jgi:hypothetical protein
MAATDARPVPIKNTAYRHYFHYWKTDSTMLTSITGADTEVSKDGGTFTDCTNEFTEIGTSGPGYIELTSTEMNADSVVIKSTCTNTGAVPYIYYLYPEEAGDIRANAAQLGGTTQTGRDIGASVLLSSGTGTGQLSLTSGLVTLAGVTHTNAVIPTVTTTTTATNLTNLPSIPASWLTAAGIAGSALNGKGDWPVGKTGYSLTATTGLGNQTANITGNLSGSVGSVTGAVGSVTAAVTAGTVSDKTGYSLTATTGLGNQTANITGNLSGSVGSVTGAVGSVATAGNEAIADAVINRNIQGGSNTGRTVRQALAALRNKVVVSGGTMTVYATDDTASEWTASVTTTAGNPITTIDPA